MTPDESTRLTTLERKVADIHRVFFDSPAEGGDPLVRRVMAIVIAAERGEWAARWTIRIIVGLGALVGAIAAIKGFIR